jgi:hypothetical protein
VKEMRKRREEKRREDDAREGRIRGIQSSKTFFLQGSCLRFLVLETPLQKERQIERKTDKLFPGQNHALATTKTNTPSETTNKHTTKQTEKNQRREEEEEEERQTLITNLSLIPH